MGGRASLRVRSMLAMLCLVVAGCGSASPNPTGQASAAIAPSSPSATSPITDASPPITPEPLPTDVALPLLSAPLALGGGDPAERAIQLAAALRDPAQLAAALPAAFLASGIPVVDESGASLDPSLGGLPVEAWEVSVLAALDPAHGVGLLLDDLAATLQASDEALVDAPLGDLMLADLHDGAVAADPTTQTWALTIVELGRQRDETDLLTIDDPAQVALDGMQVQLILRKFANDLALEADAVSFVRPFASIGGGLPVDSSRAVAAPPCSYTQTEDTIITVAEEVLGRGFGKVLDYAKDKGVGGADKVGRMLKMAGVGSSLSKFLMTYLLLRTDFEMSGSGPLARTRKQRPQTGERRQLTAKVYYDTGNAQVINCFRLAFASMGLSFTVPNHGPVAGAGVSWQAVKGFDARRDRIVQFVGSDPTRGATDTNGLAHIDVEGFGQEREIPEGSPQVQKSATVWLMVQMKQTSLAGDLWDAVKLWEGGLGPAVILDGVLESLYRSKLLAPQAFTFPVSDWQLDGFVIDFSADDLPLRTSSIGTDATFDLTGQAQACPEVDGTWLWGGEMTVDYSDDYPLQDQQGRLVSRTLGQTPLLFSLEFEPFGEGSGVTFVDALGDASGDFRMVNGLGETIGPFELELTVFPATCS